jgi:DNA-binding MarR family transcriptional regulator
MTVSDDLLDKRVPATESYVGETMHAALKLRPWPEAQSLPPYLRNSYFIAEGDLRGRRSLWLFARDEPTPAAIEKHLSTIGERWPDAQVVVFDRLPSYVRRRLIEKGISFVVPGTQLYVPEHGLDFRSRARQSLEKREALRPSAQAMLLYLLLHVSESASIRSASGLAPLLGQSLMTASRAVAELESNGLIRVRSVGRTREISLQGEAREVWQGAQTLLRTPVMKRTTLVDGPPAFADGYVLAGLSALSMRSMLAEPRAHTYAVGRVRARAPEAAGAATTRHWPMDEEESATVEVWSYDPMPLSDGYVVDPLSLSLSLRDDPDERVQAALGRLLESLSW